MSGESFPQRYSKKSFVEYFFLFIFSYLTLSLTAAIRRSPPWSRTGLHPSSDRAISSTIRSGVGSSYMSVSRDNSRRKSRPEAPDCSVTLGYEDDAFGVRCILDTDIDKNQRVGVPIHRCVGELRK